jgi:hypothetical protein
VLDSAQLVLMIRRTIAIVVVLFAGLPCAVPLFAAGAESTIAACCRRDGKHHCTKTAVTSDSALPTISQDMKCPMSPRAFTTPIHSHAGLATSAAVFAEVVSHPALSPQTLSNYRVSLMRSHQKRGPPTAVLS